MEHTTIPVLFLECLVASLSALLIVETIVPPDNLQLVYQVIFYIMNLPIKKHCLCMGEFESILKQTNLTNESEENFILS